MIKKVAIGAALEAGDALLRMSKKEAAYSMKSRLDILAEADIKAEKIILDRIRKSFPEHSILSEEAGMEEKDTDFLWVVDPLDGTVNFTRKIEDYCVSIGLEIRGQLVLGVIYQPERKKLYFAEKGKGAFIGRERIRVSGVTNLESSLVATDNYSDPKKREEGFMQLSRISTHVRRTRMSGSGALQLATVAEGKMDVYYRNKFNYWDYAAGTILIEEAGGKVTDTKGRKISRSSQSVVATNGRLHETFLSIMRTRNL